MVIMEQIEECGVHSGDSAEVYPVRTVPGPVLETVEAYTRRLARAFSIRGLMNVQYAVLGDEVYVLEVNPRASRSVPFASKASGVPLADLAVRVILGERLSDLDVPRPAMDRVSVKQVVFPFRALPGAAPVLGPRMQSTGESMGTGRTFAEAYWKAWLGRGYKDLPLGKTVYLSLDGESCGHLHGKHWSPVATLVKKLAAAGCSLLGSPGLPPDLPPILKLAPREVEVAGLGLVVVLGRSRDEIALLRRAVDAGIPSITTPGSLRGLLLALEEEPPRLEVDALYSSAAVRLRRTA
jgi:hypothetical protein